MTAARVVECLGRPCPVPVIELARTLPQVAVGDLVEVLSDDPAAAYDIPAWCRMRGQSYEGRVERTVGASYSVRRLT